MKRQGYLKGALIISAGGFVSKLLGAVYRIPLIAILGGTGMGIYQMVYPLYCILLTVSASGIPTGIARLIASGNAEGAEKRAFLLYGGIGLCGSLVMYALSGILSAAQGEPAVALCCKLLSPSVLFVAIISVVRGYFQGKGNMYPTAFTEIAEQAIKVAFGILLAYIYRGDITRSVGAAVFAVTVSEAASAAFAVILYLGGRRRTKPLYRAAPSASLKSVLSYTLPLTVSAIAQPLSQLIESIVVVRILRTMTADATAVYGIFSGCAITLVNLPVSVTYGLAAASVPKISPLAQSGRISEAKEMCKKALLYTLILSLPCAAALFAFAPIATRIIFSSLSQSEAELLVRLVRIMAVNAVTLSLVQTSSACITSLGRPLFGTLSQWTSSAVRVALSAAFIAFTPLGISGAALSANIAYLVALVVNFCYIIGVKQTGRTTDVNNLDRIGSKGRTINFFGKTGA